MSQMFVYFRKITSFEKNAKFGVTMATRQTPWKPMLWQENLINRYRYEQILLRVCWYDRGQGNLLE